MVKPGLKWVSPSCIIQKKDGTVHMVTYFREVNKWLVRKLFPISKISTVLQELGGFTYATTLDMNMGYYTIRLDLDSSKICTLIFPLCKYSYLWLPRGIAGSPDIFQEKMSELIVALEFARAYLDDLLCITKASLDDHLENVNGPHQVARCELASWYPYIILLCHWNGIPRVYPYTHWN